MNVPVVLPIIRATVATDGAVSVTVDDKPYVPTDGLVCPITRAGLRKLIDQITSERQIPVRVEVIESDGTAYADIFTPPIPSPKDGDDTPHQPLAAPGLSGSGFRPGERLAVAYVLMHDTADDTGHASVHLPAALLTSRKASLVLLGLDSKTITTTAPGPTAADATA